nr:hypothetical protein GCM10020092_049490 [Actinoplanes digitatis]
MSGGLLGLGTDQDLGLEGLVALVLDRHTGALLEGLVGVLVRLVLRGHDAREDGHRLALEIAELLVEVAVDRRLSSRVGIVVRVVTAAACGETEHQARAQRAGERAPEARTHGLTEHPSPYGHITPGRDNTVTVSGSPRVPVKLVETMFRNVSE